MARIDRHVLLASAYFASASAVDAQAPKQNQQKIDDLVRSAELFETLGTILGAAGVLVVILGIVYAIYADRKKMARKLESRSEEPRRRKNPELE